MSDPPERRPQSGPRSADPRSSASPHDDEAPPTLRQPTVLPVSPRPPYAPASDFPTPRSGGVTQLTDGDLVAGVIRDLALGVRRLENAMHQRFDAADAARPSAPSVPPPPSKRQVAATATVNFGKYAGLAVLAAFVARAIERKYPGAAEVIEGVLAALNL